MPTLEMSTFCSSSADQGAAVSPSMRVAVGKMPKNWGGRLMGQLHCLCVVGVGGDTEFEKQKSVCQNGDVGYAWQVEDWPGKQDCSTAGH